jgi:hypothetical protein
MCPLCTSEEEVYLVEKLEDGRRRVECRRCEYQWHHGDAAPPKPAGTSFLALKARFPRPDDVTAEWREHAEMLKRRFLSEVQVEPEPNVGSFWRRYQHLFSAEGLKEADPAELKLFANDPTGVYAGIMTEFNKAWNRMGPDEGAVLVRQVIDHLLRGHGELEERLTQLIQGAVPYTMPGFKEALLTKALCVVYPDRFMTIVTYDQKRIMARTVYGLDLPDADRVSWTIGRLIVWSNDLLRGLVGEGFTHQQHAGHFLWWAKDQEGHP